MESRNDAAMFATCADSTILVQCILMTNSPGKRYNNLLIEQFIQRYKAGVTSWRQTKGIVCMYIYMSICIFVYLSARLDILYRTRLGHICVRVICILFSFVQETL